MSTSYVRTHIYIEDMRTKKALSAWILLVSVFCSSGAVSGIIDKRYVSFIYGGIRGKQMTPALASERSIFSKNYDYNSYIKSFPCRGEHVRIPIFRDIDARGGRKLRAVSRPHTHTRDSHSDDNNESTEVQTLGVIRIQL